MEAAARATPVRMTADERRLQKLLCSALDVSNYTNKVEEASYHSRERVVVEQLYELYQVMLGLNINASAKGKKLVKEIFRDGRRRADAFASPKCAEWISGVFEIGRRYKRMNPDKMRTEYGKLVMIMQDAGQLRREMGIDAAVPIVSVHARLEAHGLLGLLGDADLPAAASPLPRLAPDALAEAAQAKAALTRELAERHGGADPERREAAELCIRSLDDGACVLRDTAEVLTRMMGLLERYFHPQEGEWRGTKHFDLSIDGYTGGAKLRHSHFEQYFYVMESLTLWRCILGDIFNTWSAAEDDMLDPAHPYRMRNTGQGVHRVKSAPRTSSAMREHIARADREMRAKGGPGWVGTKIVHLGDNDVPNALVFIDKYTQVPRIVAPVLNVIESIDRIVELPGQRQYLERKFGSPELCKAAILQDFFRFGFDGSGSSGGSCIDGRLTSAWNWCSKLEKKPFHHVFLLCGFQGFDGQW